MRISRFLSEESPYRPDDKVTGIVYSVAEEIGAFVAVDGKYYGLIPTQELYTRLKVGDEVKARVLKVRPDGKLNLIPRRKPMPRCGMTRRDCPVRHRFLRRRTSVRRGCLPEKIKEEFGLSKGAFKEPWAALKAAKDRKDRYRHQKNLTHGRSFPGASTALFPQADRVLVCLLDTIRELRR